MHIVQALVSLNIGGSELVATELSEYLIGCGHKVTIIAADGPLGPRARASGAAHLDWPIGKKRLATLRYIKRLSEWFAAEKPDIVHVHSRLPAWICWRAINRLSLAQRPLLVTTMHGHYSVSRYSSVMARGRKTIAVSEHIRRYTLRNYQLASPHDVVTIHGGASRALFPYKYQAPPGWREQAEREFPELTNKRWLLLPGRITRWKGHVDFMHLIGTLIKDYPDIQGLFVGGGKAGSRYQLELEALAEKTGIGEAITFTGNRLDIRDWMSASEIIFNLSNDPPEAFGRTVLESLCLGRPMIAWDHGGAAEILAAMFPQGAVKPLDFRQLEERARQFLQQQPLVEASNAFSLETS
ncbi:MAG: glycosyltransferase, partial [Xanthomonadales bacterium]|nr:glycosyltransferase [Xanthomonadales bacterium]